MKKQFLCLLLALILTVGLLPANVLADTEKPEAMFDFLLSGEEIPEDTEAALVLNAGDDTRYYATKSTDPAFPNNYYLTPCEESEWNVKFEYPADGIPTITLKDATIINKYGLWFGGINIPMTSDVKVILEGTNYLEYVSNTDTVLPLYGALVLRTTGTATITGSGELNIISDHHYVKEGQTVMSGALAADGNLILDNTNIFISMPETKGKTNGVYSGGGDVTVKGGRLKLVSYDDPKTYHDPGEESGYRRNQEAILSAVYIKKTENGDGGNFTVQDDADVQIMASVYKGSYNKGYMMYIEGTFTIKDSTVALGFIGKTSDGVSLFEKKPTFEFTNNTYTIAATNAKPAYTDSEVAITPNEEKLVDFLADDARIALLSYFSVTPGGPGGPYCELPPEAPPADTTPSEPTETIKPTQPSEPAETSKPTQPSEPAETTKPTQPSEPAATSKPTQPSKPAETSKPTQPSKPAETTPTATEDTSPNPATQPTQSTDETQKPDAPTSSEKDSGSIILWIITGVAALAAAAGAFVIFWFIIKPQIKKNK